MLNGFGACSSGGASAFGAEAQLQIYHPDAASAATLIERSLAEVKRLEKIFSLYDETSAHADALSTAFSLMPLERCEAVLKGLGATAAWFVLRDGEIVVRRA